MDGLPPVPAVQPPGGGGGAGARGRHEDLEALGGVWPSPPHSLALLLNGGSLASRDRLSVLFLAVMCRAVRVRALRDWLREAGILRVGAASAADTPAGLRLASNLSKCYDRLPLKLTTWWPCARAMDGWARGVRFPPVDHWCGGIALGCGCGAIMWFCDRAVLVARAASARALEPSGPPPHTCAAHVADGRCSASVAAAPKWRVGSAELGAWAVSAVGECVVMLSAACAKGSSSLVSCV